MPERHKGRGKQLKTLVLCAGKGTRLRPLTDSIPKPLVPVANRPILFHILDRIKETGISEIGIVVSPDNFNSIKEHVREGTQWGFDRVEYILQEQAGGLAHAVISAEVFLGDSPFMLFLGDNLVQDNLGNVVDLFWAEHYDALVVLKEVTDPRSFGVAELNGNGRLVRLVEKPKEPRSNLALVGVYLFSPEIHKATHFVQPSWRGELEITDAIQKLIESGKEVHSFTLDGWWLDTGKATDLLKANQIMLEESINGKVEGNVDALSAVSGIVNIAKDTEIINSTVQGPVSVGPGCRIENCFLLPFTSVGAKCKIKNATIQNSIIMETCFLQDIKFMGNSILGSEVSVVGLTDNPVELVLGSYARISGLKVI